MLDYKAVGDTIIVTVRDYVARSVASLSNRLDATNKRLTDYIAEQPDLSLQINQKLTQAIAGLPVPQNGIDGKSVTLNEVLPSVCEIVKQVVSTLPAPKDGADGRNVDFAEVKAAIEAAVAALPAPENGRDADPEQVRAVAAEEAAKAVSAIALSEPAPTIPEIELMFEGMVAKAVAAIPVPQNGKSVPVEDVQRMIDDAVAKAMLGIKLPKDGDPGRDAAQIEILPAIDEAKSYPRSTYAKHAGGLWRSYETTSGIKGWECIVEGVKSLDILMPTERDFQISIQSSSGTSEVKTFSLPVMLYKYVFREGTQYTHGDTVTWGGSLWHCNADTTEKPREGSSIWTLCTKKGRDGADGKPIPAAGKK